MHNWKPFSFCAYKRNQHLTSHSWLREARIGMSDSGNVTLRRSHFYEIIIAAAQKKSRQMKDKSSLNVQCWLGSSSGILYKRPARAISWLPSGATANRRLLWEDRWQTGWHLNTAVGSRTFYVSLQSADYTYCESARISQLGWKWDHLVWTFSHLFMLKRVF